MHRKAAFWSWGRIFAFAPSLFASAMLLGGTVRASPTFANAVTNGIVDIAGLTEASGVVASRNNPEVLWTHNDSGHPAQLFVLDTQGRLLGTYSIPGNVDNEDIAIGPGPVTNVSYLYVGDIGDNASTRANIKVYQIPEPAVYCWQYTNPVTTGMKGARTITLTYPDGAQNAEAMFVDPVTADLFILTKASPSRVYTAARSQLDTNNSFALTFVRTVNFAFPSAADISPDGSEIIVRHENSASLWLRTNGQSIAGAFGGAAIGIPVTGTANGEPNGEAIGFDSGGSGYFTLSDSISVQPLRYFARTSHDGPPPPPRVLIPPGSTWSYRDDGSDQGSAWRTPDFNDSFWRSGEAQFGYGDGDENTVVSYGSNPNNKFIATYFRRQFAVVNAADVTNLTLQLVVDDGAAIFLNGTAALHENLGSGATYNTLASPMPVALQSTWHSYDLDPHLLIEGTNTIATEIHQSSITGPNISFDLQLLAAGRNTAYEPFDYPVGTPLILVTNKTGQWWTAAGVGVSQACVAAEGLSVTGLANGSAGSIHFGASNGPSARFNLISNTTNGTLYYSTVLQVENVGTLTTNGGWFAGFNNSRGSQSATPTVLGNRILARSTATGGINLGVAKNSTNTSDWVWSDTAFSTNQTIFLVGSYTFNPNSASDDVSMLWINPDPYDFGAATAPAPTLIATRGADITANQIASFVFLQRGLSSSDEPAVLVADELRIGTSWASVTPAGPIQPVLNIMQDASGVVLSWTTNAAGFVLQATSAVDGTSFWTNISGPVAISGGSFRLTNAAPASPLFYRLKK